MLNIVAKKLFTFIRRKSIAKSLNKLIGKRVYRVRDNAARQLLVARSCSQDNFFFFFSVTVRETLANSLRVYYKDIVLRNGVII